MSTVEEESAKRTVDALSNLLANISDTLRSRGFPAGKPIDERVIALAQDRDTLKHEVERLREAWDGLIRAANMGDWSGVRHELNKARAAMAKEKV